MKLLRTGVATATAFAALPAFYGTVAFGRDNIHGGVLEGHNQIFDARQFVTSGSSISFSSSTSSANVTSTSTPTLVTNPTAVSLSLINSAESVAPTRALSTTAVAGSVPTFLTGAPQLPDATALRPADYPTLDKTPPVDSDEVKGWIEEVRDTGIVIPDLSATNPGGCTNNTAIESDSARCWWTCGGCTRSTDITECPTAMDWGLTYDDGPSPYTPDLLAYLDEVQLKSTFFVVGSRVISYPQILQAEYMAGHQIAVHTWSHPSLTTLTNEQIIAELGWTRKVIKDVLGVTPNMMRPPSGDIDDRVRAISLAMGLTPVMWSRADSGATFDTEDFDIRSGTTSVIQVLQNWKNIIGNATSRSSGFIVLEHDLFEQTVEVATGYILPDALAQNPPFNIQPVISCLGMGMEEAYVETNDNTTNPPVVSEAVASGEVTITGSAASATVSATSGSSNSSGSSVRFSVAGLYSLIGIVICSALSFGF